MDIESSSTLPSASEAAERSPPWQVGQKVDVLDPRCNGYFPGEVLDVIRRVKDEGEEEEDMMVYYKVRMGHEDSWEEDGVEAARLAPEGSKLARWRLLHPANELEIKVDGVWRYGRIFNVRERRWFMATVLEVNPWKKRIHVHYKAPTTAKNLAQEFVDMNTGRIRRLQGGEESQVQVGEEVEILIDRIQNDARWVYWRYNGPLRNGVLGREDDPLTATVDINVLDCPGVTFRSVVASSDDISRPGVHLFPFNPPPPPCTSYGG